MSTLTYSSFSGVVEMNGFKEDFNNVFSTSVQGFYSNSSQVDSRSNDTYSFCSLPDDGTDSATCGFGNGVDSASLIVSSLQLIGIQTMTELTR